MATEVTACASLGMHSTELEAADDAAALIASAVADTVHP